MMSYPAYFVIWTADYVGPVVESKDDSNSVVGSDEEEEFVSKITSYFRLDLNQEVGVNVMPYSF